MAIEYQITNVTMRCRIDGNHFVEQETVTCSIPHMHGITVSTSVNRDNVLVVGFRAARPSHEHKMAVYAAEQWAQQLADEGRAYTIHDHGSALANIEVHVEVEQLGRRHLVILPEEDS